MISSSVIPGGAWPSGSDQARKVISPVSRSRPLLLALSQTIPLTSNNITTRPLFQGTAEQIQKVNNRVESAPRAFDDSAVQAQPWWRRLRLTEIFGKSPAFAFSALILLLLMISAGWLFLQNKRLRQELNQTQSARATQEKREREVQEEIANQRA